MIYYASHTYGNTLNVNIILVPSWFTYENPANERIVLIYKSNLAVDWVQTSSFPST